ncbi:hypothetical protein U3516DRAFT_671240 [Neocallimastix sp. 'constans']
MERIILNKNNYKIWSKIVTGELEDASLVHTILPHIDTNNTEKTGEETIETDSIRPKDDSKARRIIYKHLSEDTWTEIEDIDTAFEIWKYLKAYYEESDDEKARKYKKRLEELTYKGETVRTYIVSFENL